ncbi:M3 family oligoendopeptidase [Chengkuizengella axinellae]|uniref:M3 family oligoendopeptidase n=1 Tax=Chengkuizengella axinellae TaxID=3064388 RepID=A0ABT9J042_9BACL|nr:M3 family oligoendopeptidase [Chengkuizengella sp. 2205SS18-9]MDP5274988.1 M3 family oligoendopeptidase [Chengkuizengella sp. 2205SS18-9]
MKNTLNQRWDLDSIFDGGSNSPQLELFLTQLENDILNEAEELKRKQITDIKDWVKTIHRVQDIYARLFEVEEFVICLISNDVEDHKAKLLKERTDRIASSYKTLENDFEMQLFNISEHTWNELIIHSEIESIAFPLNKMREYAKTKFPLDQESLINDLSVSGFNAWYSLYQSTINKVNVKVDLDGELETLALGKAYNKLISSSDRKTRKHIAQKMEQACKEHADIFAASFNNIAGFRLQVNKRRNKEDHSILTTPLRENRLSYETLDMMWSVINKNKSIIKAYFERKAQYLGIEKLNWFDVSSPLDIKTTQHYSYEEAAELIINLFSKFSSSMSLSAKQAIEEKWIDIEIRSTKAIGGFAARFPITKQSRVFMSYHGTPESLRTLAHELGHVFHQQMVLDDIPPFCQKYPTSIAETASTFAETIVANEMVESAEKKEQKIALLDQKIQNSVSYLCHIQARFEFEKQFYELRKKGSLTVEHINDLYVKAEKDAYQGYLEDYSDFFWMMIRHFYFTDRSFYNFPYTFGYLYSQGLYAYALKNRTVFEKKYNDLLRDTGKMTIEQLTQKHLDVDLKKQDFWQNAMDMIAADIQQFLELTTSSN